jgi:Domain of unknown function (DUF4405)
MREQRFYARAFVAFTVAWAFLIATVTGVVLYIVPHGRVAYWTNWELAALNVDSWRDIHIMFGLVFVVGGIFHLYFNWKPFKHHLAERVAGQLHLRREIMVASIFAIFVLVSAIAQLPPVDWVFHLNDTVKGAWVTSPEFEPPFGHAEELSLAGFALRQRMNLEAAVAELRAKGVKFNSPRDKLKDIASANGTNAMNIYMLIKKFEQPLEVPFGAAYTPEMVEQRFAGTGLGGKTLAQICTEVGVPVDQAKVRLTKAGITAAEDENLKAIAERHSKVPMDVLKHILVEEYRG